MGALVVLAGCTSPPPGPVAHVAATSSDAGPPAIADRLNPPGTLVMAVGAPIRTLDPAADLHRHERFVQRLVLGGLVRLDGTQVKPGLASAWQVEEGGRRVTLTLSLEARFTDDTPVTAEAVRASWLRLIQQAGDARTPDGPQRRWFSLIQGADVLRAVRPSGAFARAARVWTGVEAVDDHTLVIQFAQPVPQVMHLLAQPALSPVKPGEPLVTAGPWRVQRSRAPLLLRRHAGYPGVSPEVAPTVERIELQVHADGETAAEAVLAGALDWTGTVPVSAEKVGDLPEAWRVQMGRRVLLAPWPGSWVGPRTAGSDARIGSLSQALSWSLDRDVLNRQTGGRVQVMLGGPVPEAEDDGAAGYSPRAGRAALSDQARVWPEGGALSSMAIVHTTGFEAEVARVVAGAGMMHLDLPMQTVLLGWSALSQPPTDGAPRWRVMVLDDPLPRWLWLWTLAAEDGLAEALLLRAVGHSESEALMRQADAVLRGSRGLVPVMGGAPETLMHPDAPRP